MEVVKEKSVKEKSVKEKVVKAKSAKAKSAKGKTPKKEVPAKQVPKKEVTAKAPKKKIPEKVVEKEVVEKVVEKGKEEDDGEGEDEEKVEEEKEEAIVEEEAVVEERSFLDRVKDLISALRSAEGFDNHEGLIAFETVVQTTLRKEGEQRENLEEGIKNVFEKFYMENRENFIEEKMEFMTHEGNKIVFGMSGKANIPLSEIYSGLGVRNPELIDTVDACLYFVMQHVCPDEDLDAILEVCREFEPNKQDTGNSFLNFVGNIVGRVSDKLGKTDNKKMETEDGKIDVNAIGTVVQDLIGDDVIRGSMQDMMQNITSDDFDVNAVFKGLFNLQKK